MQSFTFRRMCCLLGADKVLVVTSMHAIIELINEDANAMYHHISGSVRPVMELKLHILLPPYP